MAEVRCPSCGEENPERAKFCLECGAALGAPAAAPRDVRKTVTILFADITGSTELGERLDPEAVRTLLARYFTAMRTVIERHGGTVEKFIGDAVMAVFGIPVAHEDDALRAARAAVEMGAALERLDVELGARIQIRTGINTGQIVAGSPGSRETLVTGDAVNVAARLEQAAGPDQILVGETTARLLRDVADLERLEPLVLKGKAKAVGVHRLHGLRTVPDVALLHAETPMIGRQAELAALQGVFDGVVALGSPLLAAAIGTAGVGKSRLVREFLASVAERTTILRGRCLPYGQGITFWPIAEIVRQAAVIEEADSAERARARLRELLDGMPEATHVGAALEGLLGLGAGGGSPVEELSWATRRLLEWVATPSPLVVVIEDIHWAEPALLDLVDHILSHGRAPIVVVTPSRPDILETHPAFISGPDRVVVHLEPLADAAARELIERLLPGHGHVVELRARIAEAADGNPLYVEELVGMLVDGGTVRRIDGGWEVVGSADIVSMPPTIGALLSARLDGLGPERTAAERGSVVGRVFEARAIAHLSADTAPSALSEQLAILVRKDLIRLDSSIIEEVAYRFRHILIRDAAYGSLAKAERARLHESLGTWLEAISGDRLAEVEEIVGYHLEQAALYQGEIGSAAEAQRLAPLAARRLAAAATRAADRGDIRAAANLLERASALLSPDDPAREAILLELAVALASSNDRSRAGDILRGVLDRATDAKDAITRANALVQLWGFGDIASEDQARIRTGAREAISVLEAAGDELGLARAWRLLGDAHWFAGEAAAAEAAIERSLGHARRARRQSDIIVAFENLSAILTTGPTPVDVGISRCDEIMESEGDDRMVGAWMAHALAHLRARRGDFAEARRLAALNRRVLEDNGQTYEHAVMAELVADVEYHAGDASAAVAVLRDGLETTRQLGKASAVLAAHLGHVAWHAGEVALAEETAEDGMAAGGWTRALTVGTLGRVRASQGSYDEAEALVREGLAYWETTDYLTYHAWTLEALGDVLALAGRNGEAVEALMAAAALHEQKGSTVGVAKVQAAIARLGS